MSAAKPRVSQATDYIVLEQRKLKDPDSDETVLAWVEAGQATHSSRASAAQEVAGKRDGRWRPVPLRNWQKAIRTWTETTQRPRAEEVEDDTSGPPDA